MASVKKNFLYNIAYQILIIIVPLITTPYVSRCLGSNNIGVYSYTYSLVTYFTLFAGLSFAMYGQREIAYVQNDIHKRSCVFWEIQIFKTITYSIAIVAYIFLCLNYSEYKSILWINLLIVLGNYFDVSWLFQGLENFKIITIRNFIIKISGCILIFIFVNNENDLLIYVAINAITIFLGYLSLWVYVPQYTIKIKMEEIKIFRNIRSIIELFIPMMASNVYNVLDKTMLGLLGNARETGYYEQTTKIITLCMALVTAIGPVVYPRMSVQYANNNITAMKVKINYIYRFILCIACPIFWGVLGISENLCLWFFGSDFIGVNKILNLYAVVLLIIPLSLISEYAILTPTNNQNKGSIAVCIGACVNFLLNILLIPKEFAVGASIATIVAESIVTFIHLYFVRSYLNGKKLFTYFLKYFIIGFIMYKIIVPIQFNLINIGINRIAVTFLQVIFGVIVYLIGLIVTKDKFINDFVNILRKNLCK